MNPVYTAEFEEESLALSGDILNSVFFTTSIAHTAITVAERGISEESMSVKKAEEQTEETGTEKEGTALGAWSDLCSSSESGDKKNTDEKQNSKGSDIM